MSRVALRLATTAAAALALSGCISVLPKSPPAQLYRFGADGPPAPAAVAPAAGATGLVLSTVSLPRAAAGDGLLAITGNEAAYLAHARWVSPAEVLMREAAARVFAGRTGRVRLLRRDEAAAAAGSLSLDVRDFEARYPAPGAAPVVRVTVHAVIARRDGSLGAERTFGVDQPAGDNRLSAIVPAYDAATRRVLDAVAVWADAAAPTAGLGSTAK